MIDLINLAPALEVALLGAVLALLAAGGVRWRARRAGLAGWPAWQHALTVATLFLTIDLVVFGAFTRLTDSGLGCPDWPGCYGQTSPWAAHAQIAVEQAAVPHGPVTHSKAWIEMTHRYLATGVGALITGLMVAGWWLRDRRGSLSPWWATATFVWVCAQGAFGALTVTLKLQPIIVTLHLLGALLGVGLLTAQVRVLEGVRSPPSERDLGTSAHLHAWASAPLRHWGWLVLTLVSVQVALGGWVSTNYAVLVCSDIPTCQGQWWPDMDFANGFHLLRALGENGQGEPISMAALTAIHMSHRLMALVIVVALWRYGAALRAWRPDAHAAVTAREAAHPWRREGLWLWGLLAWQVLSGLSNVVLGWPLAAALAHTLGATLLVWRLVHLLVLPRLVHEPIGLRAPAPQGLHPGVARVSTP
ncbi:MAG: COX15/CtaA family protein [Aquabacterium sp.]|jgi:cytochrome c oxidase assembly protein subunit 15|uniref:COX15/CtaA family protein n=1 Tax=Aquabacterium sp. TaxID=1872578 RepID=UPI002A370F53|nr:COX15/CtaA family protein [Aquabacterium sp.]MDX9844207.1 COX15/CtaA family protein [Aquabacterium sp.]